MDAPFYRSLNGQSIDENPSKDAAHAFLCGNQNEDRDGRLRPILTIHAERGFDEHDITVSAAANFRLRHFAHLPSRC